MGFQDPVTGTTFHMSRTQLPLMPASACALYALQGATCDSGMIAHFILLKRADDDIKRLIVCASTVRSTISLKKAFQQCMQKR